MSSNNLPITDPLAPLRSKQSKVWNTPTGKHPGGRPRVYTKEVCMKLAEDMRTAVLTNPDMLSLELFAGMRGMWPCELSDLAHRYDEFGKALRQIKDLLAHKIRHGALTKELSERFAIWDLTVNFGYKLPEQTIETIQRGPVEVQFVEVKNPEQAAKMTDAGASDNSKTA